jgi:hypothetical protein
MYAADNIRQCFKEGNIYPNEEQTEKRYNRLYNQAEKAKTSINFIPSYSSARIGRLAMRTETRSQFSITLKR